MAKALPVNLRLSCLRSRATNSNSRDREREREYKAAKILCLYQTVLFIRAEVPACIVICLGVRGVRGH